MNHRQKFEYWKSVVVLCGCFASFAVYTPAIAGTRIDGNIDIGLSAIRPEAIRAHMRFLADDALEGRGTAARGSEIAAKYIAAQFESLGLRPSGDQSSFFQSVPLRKVVTEQQTSELVLVRGTREERLTNPAHYYVSDRFGHTESSVEAPVVFVGAGITAPQFNYDDYQGIDARGKIVAAVFGVPTVLPSAVSAHYFMHRDENAAAHGAMGILLLVDAAMERVVPYETLSRTASTPDFSWLDPAGRPHDAFAQLRATAVLSQTGIERLFAGSGHSARELSPQFNHGRPHPFPLPVTARIHVVTRTENTASPNVVAVLEGSDPELKHQFLVYSSHFDHDGIGEPVDGDRIYNGAIDNASGVALMLEIARAYNALPIRPKRSIAFVATTGEEAGLIGSSYFAHYPTLPGTVVADLNLDVVPMYWPLRDVLAIGSEHSTLGAAAQDAARRLGLTVSPDPMPQNFSFARSDQYSFVEQGVPSAFVLQGLKSDDPKVVPSELFQRYFQERYHHPNDDMNQPFDWSSGVDLARFHMLFGYLIAQGVQPPSWNAGDFFATLRLKR